MFGTCPLDATLRCLLFACLSVLLAIACHPLSIVNADATFHTEQISLSPVGTAPLHSGFVVDIHANGPQIYALERYVLNGAVPNATFAVTISVYGSRGCAPSSFMFPIPDATFQTNVGGNGEGSTIIHPWQVPPSFHGKTLSGIWTVSSGSVTYQTACTAVSFD
jgi:hypothetical protein